MCCSKPRFVYGKNRWRIARSAFERAGSGDKMSRRTLSRATEPTDQGIATMVVIWIISVLALQVTLFNGSVHDAVRLAENEMALARGEALTQAAVELTVARLLSRDKRERWRPDGRVVDFSYAGANLRIKLSDERSRINLNYADEALLNGLFRSVTGSPQEASRLTARLLKWRNEERRPGRTDGAFPSAPQLGQPSTSAAGASTAAGAANAASPTASVLLDSADVGRALDAVRDGMLPACLASPCHSTRSTPTGC